MEAMERLNEIFSTIERVMLSSTMEVLRGPLLFATGLATLMYLWNRPRYTGLFPKDSKSWRELVSRSSAAIALSYSAMGLFRPVPLVPVIAFFFALLTIGWSYFGGEDRIFLRWWGWMSLIFSLVFGVLRPVVVE
jgi:hypothetical protein